VVWGGDIAHLDPVGCVGHDALPIGG
jgi:hypothetical protein